MLLLINWSLRKTRDASDRWRERMTAADVRGLTPLVWAHVSPYGAFDLDMGRRLDLELKTAA